MNKILEKQNSSDMIRLLKAQRVAYADTKKLQLGFELIALIVAMVLPITYIYFPDVKVVAGAIGSVLSITAIVIDRVQKHKTKEAASIQEKFDRTLFELEENIYDGVIKVPSEKIIRLANRYKKDDMQGWYSSEINPGIPHQMAVLLCQKANLNWDGSIRKKFRILILFFLLIYLLLIAFVIAKDFPNTDGFLLHFWLLIIGSAAFLKYCLTIFFEKGDIVSEKEKLSLIIDKHFEDYKKEKKQPSKEQLSQIQSKIFNSRTKNVKIPTWFYRMFKSKQEGDMDSITRGIVTDFLRD